MAIAPEGAQNPAYRPSAQLLFRGAALAGADRGAGRLTLRAGGIAGPRGGAAPGAHFTRPPPEYLAKKKGEGRRFSC